MPPGATYHFPLPYVEVVAVARARYPLWMPLGHRIDPGDSIRRQNAARGFDPLQPPEHPAVIKGFPLVVVEAVSRGKLSRHTLANAHLKSTTVFVTEFRGALEMRICEGMPR